MILAMKLAYVVVSACVIIWGSARARAQVAAGEKLNKGDIYITIFLVVYILIFAILAFSTDLLDEAFALLHL